MTPSECLRRGRLMAAVDVAWDRLDGLARHAAGYATLAIASAGINFAVAAGCPPEVGDEIERRLGEWRLAVGTLEEFELRIVRQQQGKGVHSPCSES